MNYDKSYKLSKVDFIFSCSDATLVAFFIFCLAFNIIRLAPVTVFAYFFSFFRLFSSFSLAQSILCFLPFTFSSLRYLHIHLISLVSMLASVFSRAAFLMYPWREIFLANLDLLPEFEIGSDLSKKCFTIILKEKVTNTFVALMYNITVLYNRT